MSFPQRILIPTFLALGISTLACRIEQGNASERVEHCEDVCSQAQGACASDPAFGSSWQLSCEVSCNLESEGEPEPIDACLDAAATCTAKNECVNGGFPSSSDGGASSEDDAADDDPSAADGNDDDPSAGSSEGGASSEGGDGSSSGGEIIGHACCDTSGVGCSDPEVTECTCQYLPQCCTGVWDEACASVAVANDCIETGCSTLEGQGQWDCSCSTTSVYCPEDPFVSQIIYSTDVCGVAQQDALTLAAAACEADPECEVTAGSCDCTCDSYGEVCGPV
jgi:hypothetical protein